MARRTMVTSSGTLLGRGWREDIAGLGTHMRVLHEALVETIELIQEGRPGWPRSRR